MRLRQLPYFSDKFFMFFQFPPANQAQIIRSNQRDLFHVGALREQTESLLQTCFGTRWLLRWDKELELFSKLAYFGLSTVHASQTLGEEYTDIWQQSSHMQTIPSRKARSVLTVLSTLPPYLISRMTPRLSVLYPDSQVVALLRRLPLILEVISETNLAVFYFFGTYYDFKKRLTISQISSTPQNPNITPPSYSLLGILLSIRLLYRLFTSLRFLSLFGVSDAKKVPGKRPVQQVPSDEPKLDARSISFVLEAASMAERDPIPAEEDENTLVDVVSLSPDERAGRRCTLCLDERTSTCATECGHLFCWTCVMNWGREKPECPLCRQSLNLTRLLPVYNL